MSGEKSFGCFWNTTGGNKNVSIGTLSEKDEGN